ncbi:MAG: prepilin peptidase [Clostridiales bacterium]|nr:prepilin peptidase [Clostridiales bacterium]
MEQIYFYSTVIIFAVVGLCVGSFLNVVISRLPYGISLAFPRSTCPKCKSQIKWYDNIPLIAYLILGGKCRNCKQNISFEYFFVELLNLILWFLSAVFFYTNGIFYTAIVCIFLSALICVALIDEKHLFIPDSLQLVILICSVANLFINYGIALNLIGGFLIGAIFFLFFYFASFLLFKREGLGFGDIKLMGVAGLMLGAKAVCVAIFISVILALIGIIIKHFVSPIKTRLPIAEPCDEFAFAPYLCLGIAFSLFFGEQIADIYLSILII